MCIKKSLNTVFISSFDFCFKCLKTKSYFSSTNFLNFTLYTQQTNNFFFFFLQHHTRKYVTPFPLPIFFFFSPTFSPPYVHTHPHPSLIFFPFSLFISQQLQNLFPLAASKFSFFLFFLSVLTTCPFNLFFFLFSSSPLSSAAGSLGFSCSIFFLVILYIHNVCFVFLLSSFLYVCEILGLFLAHSLFSVSFFFLSFTNLNLGIDFGVDTTKWCRF